VSENDVIHHLKLYSFENWLGIDQHRHARLDVTNDTLTPSTAPTVTLGRKNSNRLQLETYRFNAGGFLRCSG
jgi:hypothetical protein